MRSYLLSSVILLLCVSVYALEAETSVSTGIFPYDPVLGQNLLRISGAMYCPTAAINSWSCASCQRVPTYKPVTTVANQNMLANVGLFNGNIVVAFKGTDFLKISEWITDTHYSYVDRPDYCTGCKVHQGFLASYTLLQQGVISAVQSLQQANPAAQIIITGHSLGGALATLCARDFASRQGLAPSTVYVFGSPRTGNEQFQANFNQVFANIVFYRIVNQKDLVPHLPPETILWVDQTKYRHVGTEVWYTSFTAFQTCKANCEDKSCSDSVKIPSFLDHGSYMGTTFTDDFMKCQAQKTFGFRQLPSKLKEIQALSPA